MVLYDRDYTKITEEEIEKYKKVEKSELVYGYKEPYIRKNLYREYPKAIRHYKSLFPNYFLDFCELKEEDRLNLINSEFEKLLNSNCNEQDVLSFIKDNKAYYIIGSLLTLYRFGNHEAYIFPEFQLGTNYRADYLIVGKSSGGYEFVFVELEHPNKNDITLKDGRLGNTFRKGIEQVKDWKRWINRNFSTLREFFENNIKYGKALPKEFIAYDFSRFHYLVVAGKRKDFNDLTHLEKREMHLDLNIELCHYDNLLNYAVNIVGRNCY